jgi:hypothetical protein
MIDPTAIAEAAAARLNVPAADLLEPAEAALEYIAWDISSTVDALDPDSSLLFIGARLLCERIYQDVPTTSGDVEGLVTANGTFIPADLGHHLRDYWTPQQEGWGVA